MHFSAKAGADILSSPTSARIMADSLISLFFIDLLCYGGLIIISGFTGVTNEARYKSGDAGGKTDNNKTNDGVGESIFSFLKFTWIAGRS